MKIVIAIDSFKESLSSIEAGKAASEGIKRVFPNSEIIIKPVADGGEGTVNALTIGLNGHFKEISVSDPLGRRIKAKYGILPDKTAIIEMATASGLTLLNPNERNPMFTTTYGTGELILDAIEYGCRNIIIGIGGSATNDGGIGCLQALGFRFLDKNGNQIEFGANGLSKLHHIDTKMIHPILNECHFNVACDVTNPLCGPKGCSAVFGPQKGADSEMISEMDKYLLNYAEKTKQLIPESNLDSNGSGAAGGLGFALRYYLNANLEPGVQLIARVTDIEEEIKKSDIIVTGEGCLDSQTVMGKAPIGIAKIAKKYNKPVIAFSGAIKIGAKACNQNGIDAYFSILRQISTLDEAMNNKNAFINLSDTAEQVFRSIKLFIK